MKENLTFGQALEAAREGKLISRSGWNGKGMFVFMRPGDMAETGTLDHTNSIPQSFKNWMHENTAHEHVIMYFVPYLCMKAANDTIVNGWLASQTDILSNDWCILDY